MTTVKDKEYYERLGMVRAEFKKGMKPLDVRSAVYQQYYVLIGPVEVTWYMDDLVFNEGYEDYEEARHG